jgi:hypothetical protein
MRFTRRPRASYTITHRKRAAAARLQLRQREAHPLLAPLIAETQPGIDAVMADRAETWNRTEQDWRDRRASQWRRARRALDAYEPTTRRALLAYWNGHRWLPGDPAYLLDLLHGFRIGRLLLEHDQVRPAVVEVPVSMATATFGPEKPMARSWLGPPRNPGALRGR